MDTPQNLFEPLLSAAYANTPRGRLIAVIATLPVASATFLFEPADARVLAADLSRMADHLDPLSPVWQAVTQMTTDAQMQAAPTRRRKPRILKQIARKKARKGKR